MASYKLWHFLSAKFVKNWLFYTVFVPIGNGEIIHFSYHHLFNCFDNVCDPQVYRLLKLLTVYNVVLSKPGLICQKLWILNIKTVPVHFRTKQYWVALGQLK